MNATLHFYHDTGVFLFILYCNKNCGWKRRICQEKGFYYFTLYRCGRSRNDVRKIGSKLWIAMVGLLNCTRVNECIIATGGIKDERKKDGDLPCISRFISTFYSLIFFVSVWMERIY
ncbi:MAG: hypothetical protein M3Z92_01985, partial [Bacteroidota bacterium]|nr:hypothetical protein [Bacteroidota bacterium]